MSRFPCVQQATPEGGPWAALATLALHHGIDMPSQVQSTATLPGLAETAREIGFDTRPARASFEVLGRCPLPLIVELEAGRGERFLLAEGERLVEHGRRRRFVVVFTISDDAVEIADPELGPRRLSRREFEAEWNGGLLLALPTTEARPASRSRLGSLAARRLPSAVAGLALLVFACLVGTRAPSMAIAGVLLALGGSVGAIFTGRRCASCEGARRLLGLDLAPLGVALYGALAALTFTPVPVAPVLFLAAGLHLALLHHLEKARLRCPPCLVTAAGALLAGGLAAPATPVLALTVVVFSALWSFVALDLVVSRRAVTVRTRRREQLEEIVRSEPEPSEGTLRVLAYSKEGCGYCRLLDEAVLPGLARALGARLQVERRRVEGALLAPTLVLVGVRRAVIQGLPEPAILEEALALASAD